MKKITNFLLFALSLSQSFAQYYTAPIEYATPFVLPSWSDNHGIIRFTDMPSFSLPSDVSIINTGGPIRDFQGNFLAGTTSHEDTVIFHQMQDMVNHGWTHTDFSAMSFYDPHTSIISTLPANIPNNGRALFLSGDAMWKNMPVQHNNPFGNNVSAIVNNILATASGKSAQYAGYTGYTGMIDYDFVCLDVEELYLTPDGNDSYRIQLLMDIVQGVRALMKPGAGLYLYGPFGGGMDGIFSPSYRQQIDNGKIWSETGPVGGVLHNPSIMQAPFYDAGFRASVDYSTYCRYPATGSMCGSSGCSDYDVLFCDTLINPHRRYIQDLLGTKEYHDYHMNLRAPSDRSKLMFMPSLMYYGEHTSNPCARRIFTEVKTLSTEDAKGLAIFPLMMGYKAVSMWQANFGTGTGDHLLPEYPLSMIESQLRTKIGRVYEDYTNGLYMMSQFNDMFDGSEEYYNPGENVYDWSSRNYCYATSNAAIGCNPAFLANPYTSIKPFWRAVRNGDYLLVAAQNVYAAQTGLMTFQVTYNLNGYNFTTDPITLTGDEVYLAKYCMKDPGTACVLSADEGIELSLSKGENYTNIAWTSSKVNQTSKFLIDHSLDGRVFFQVGEVSANQGQNSYNYQDDKPVVGLNYYRIRTISQSGESTTSEVKSILYSANPSVQVYPNPAVKTVWFELNAFPQNQDILLKIVNTEGKVVLEQVLNSDNPKYEIKVEGLAAGIYGYQLISEENTLTGLLTVQ